MATFSESTVLEETSDPDGGAEPIVEEDNGDGTGTNGGGTGTNGTGDSGGDGTGTTAEKTVYALVPGETTSVPDLEAQVKGMDTVQYLIMGPNGVRSSNKVIWVKTALPADLLRMTLNAAGVLGFEVRTEYLPREDDDSGDGTGDDGGGDGDQTGTLQTWALVPNRSGIAADIKAQVQGIANMTFLQEGPNGVPSSSEVIWVQTRIPPELIKGTLAATGLIEFEVRETYEPTGDGTGGPPPTGTGGGMCPDTGTTTTTGGGTTEVNVSCGCKSSNGGSNGSTNGSSNGGSSDGQSVTIGDGTTFPTTRLRAPDDGNDTIQPAATGTLTVTVTEIIIIAAAILIGTRFL